MNVDIRVAVAGDELQKRLRLAAGLLQAHKIEGSLRPWDGTRCDCAIVAADDLYGERIQNYARRKQIPVLAITRANDRFDPATATIGEHAPINVYVRALLNLLKAEAKPAAPAQATAASVTSRTAGLIVLAQALSRQTGDLVMALDRVEIGICPSTGTIHATSVEVLLQARQLLGQPGWQLREAAGRQFANGHGESLDIFMIRAGIHHGEALPLFPLEGSRMRCWPDLGTAPDLIEPLRVASLLAKGHRDLQKVAGLTGIEPVQASGILWGFQAAGLIVPDQQKMPSPHPKTASNDRLPASGLFQKLAARFGLFQKAS